VQHPGGFSSSSAWSSPESVRLWLVAPHIPWLGRLPGDIAVERPNFRFYFPVVTCVVLSLVLTGILGLVQFFRNEQRHEQQRIHWHSAIFCLRWNHALA
jgi:hypothetical protein